MRKLSWTKMLGVHGKNLIVPQRNKKPAVAVATAGESVDKAQAFFEAGVDSSVPDCFNKSEVTPPNGITARFLKDNAVQKTGAMAASS